ncbi:DUF7474 family protein [Halorarum salinum]|uniref:Uncharacterized protein n=1 Tax=Halorarum salinum TaxID=2743089 RepID=A0A7D5QFV2_9EURY|nr:hypothetical protein [Halobaculum salinum]QLG60984.1 hypothetical protein HUG12_04230 [Halobaculum salinum]
MPRFAYPCPGCRTTNSLHDAACDFEGTAWHAVEKAYTDLLAVLVRETVDEDALRHAVHGEWSGLHNAALDLLVREGRVREADAGLRLLTAEEYREAVSEPTTEPMATIHRRGSYPGAHDNAVFAMIAWYEMVGLSWEETRQHAVEWLRESGTWARGGFEEASPEALVDKKRHVYEAGYGWKEKARAAKRVIEAHRG